MPLGFLLVGSDEWCSRSEEKRGCRLAQNRFMGGFRCADENENDMAIKARDSMAKIPNVGLIGRE